MNYLNRLKSLFAVNSSQTPKEPPSILRDPGERVETHTVEDVARHYDTLSEHYRGVYGEVLQAYRPTAVEELLQLEMEAADLQDGMRVLDAGCGLCGPAIWFARHRDIQIEALTVSGVQAEMAQKAVETAGLAARIHVKTGDYHHLRTLYPPGMFDRALFLESLCHAEDYQQVLSGVREALRPGGCIYIKDFEPQIFPEDADKQREMQERYAKCYQEYHIALSRKQDLTALLARLGFCLELDRSVPIRPDAGIQVGFEKQVGFQWRDGLTFNIARCFELRARRVDKKD